MVIEKHTEAVWIDCIVEREQNLCMSCVAFCEQDRDVHQTSEGILIYLGDITWVKGVLYVGRIMISKREV